MCNYYESYNKNIFRSIQPQMMAFGALFFEFHQSSLSNHCCLNSHAKVMLYLELRESFKLNCNLVN